MTISEELHFSVLTAPIAAVDRRALSQAWFSALYGTHDRAAEQTQKKPPGSAHVPLHSVSSADPRTTAAPLHVSAQKPRTPGTAQTRQGAGPERRSPRLALAAKIERRLQQSRGPIGGKTFSLEGALGRVRILLQTRGRRHHLIAICPRAARPQVAAALAQARYTLALRGIDLDVRTCEAQTCK